MCIRKNVLDESELDLKVIDKMYKVNNCFNLFIAKLSI